MTDLTGVVAELIASLMVIGKWSELRDVSVLHSAEVSRDIEAKETSGDAGWLLDGSLVGVFSLRTPYSENSISPANLLLRVSTSGECQRGSCALASPSTRVLSVFRSGSIEALYPSGHELVGGM